MLDRGLRSNAVWCSIEGPGRVIRRAPECTSSRATCEFVGCQVSCVWRPLLRLKKMIFQYWPGSLSTAWGCYERGPYGHIRHSSTPPYLDPFGGCWCPGARQLPRRGSSPSRAALSLITAAPTTLGYIRWPLHAQLSSRGPNVALKRAHIDATPTPTRYPTPIFLASSRSPPAAPLHSGTNIHSPSTVHRAYAVQMGTFE
jgi:hypothetical protein